MAAERTGELTAPQRATRRGLLEGVVLGTVYGVLLRGYFVLQRVVSRHLVPYQADDLQALHRSMLWNRVLGYSGGVMTLAFLVLGPVIIGYLTIRRLESTERSGVGTWIFAPWVAVLCMMAVIAVFAWEGAICILMALPLTLLFASIGGVVGGMLSRFRRPTLTRSLSVAVLPFLLAPAEALMPAPIQIRIVHNEIRIHADADTVWHNIERVPPIAPAELRPDWTHRLGFPRPVEATLSFEGVGGVRHASFEHGVLFIETVTAWQPKSRLAFTIRADNADIPATTLDEHVTIGGQYFDVLDGEYRLEPLPGGDTLLHLTSHQRLSTDFNGYAGLWTSAVMSNLQTSILQVIQHRCEHTSATALTSR